MIRNLSPALNQTAIGIGVICIRGLEPYKDSYKQYIDDHLSESRRSCAKRQGRFTKAKHRYSRSYHLFHTQRRSSQEGPGRAQKRRSTSRGSALPQGHRRVHCLAHKQQGQELKRRCTVTSRRSVLLQLRHLFRAQHKCRDGRVEVDGGNGWRMRRDQ